MINQACASPNGRSSNYINKDYFTPEYFEIIKEQCNDCPSRVKDTIYDMWWRMSTGDSHPYMSNHRTGKIINGSDIKYQRDFSKHFATVLDGKNSITATNNPFRNTWGGSPIGNTTHAERNVFSQYKRQNKLSRFQSEKKLRKEKG